MIEVTGNYIFDLKVAKYENFLKPEDLVEFTLFEEAGNILPVFELKFNFGIDDLRNYLIENNVLKVTFGKDLDSAIDVPLVIMVKNIYRKEGDHFWRAEISGVYNAMGFMTGDTSTSYSEGGKGIPGSEAIKRCVSKYFTFESNIEKSKDKQVWIKQKESDFKFTTKAWLHSNLGDSFPATAITADGKYLYKDMKLEFTKDPKYKLVNYTPSKPDEIPYVGTPVTESNTSLFNTYSGYGAVKKKIDLLTGEETLVEREITPALATVNDREKLKGIVEKHDKYCFVNDNVDPSYWDAYFNNLENLLYFSCVRAVITINGQHVPLNLLDIVTLLDSNSRGVTEGYYSGKYIVEKIVRGIGRNSQYVTHVVLVRESFNEVKDYEAETSQPQPILEVTTPDYTEVLNKAHKDVMEKLKSRNIQMNIPVLKTVNEGDYLAKYMDKAYAFTDRYIALKSDYLNRVNPEELKRRILSLSYMHYLDRGFLNSVPEFQLSTILSDYADLIRGGYLDIPIIGSVSINDVKQFTSDMFAVWVSGGFDGLLDGVLSTGNLSLDGILKEVVSSFTGLDFIQHIKSEFFAIKGLLPVKWFDSNVNSKLENNPKFTKYKKTDAQGNKSSYVVINIPDITVVDTEDSKSVYKLADLYEEGKLGTSEKPVDTGDENVNRIIKDLISYFEKDLQVNPTKQVVNLILNGKFEIEENNIWRWGKGWIKVGRKAQHVQGETEYLEQEVNIVAGRKYLLSFNMKDRTEGSMIVDLGGATATNIISNTKYNIILEPKVVTPISFKPTYSFNGSITNISLVEITYNVD